jgi:hypothetical protein
MNYLKIYDDLIESRKVRPMVQGVYYERHHIIASCQGGSDDPSNLIYLTAEDHFIAHLLLARGHNTKGLWLAVHSMTMTTHGREIKHRRAFAKIRLEISDQARHIFRHIETGAEVAATRAEMSLKVFSINVPGLLQGRVKTSMGYCMASTTMDELERKLCRGIHKEAEIVHTVTGQRFKNNVANLKRLLCLTSDDFYRLYEGYSARGFVIA